jgi:hypothetical protein
VEWTPLEIGDDLENNAKHQSLMERNRAHLVVHGETLPGWLQDRVRELNQWRPGGTAGPRPQAILLADPKRGDKTEEEILVKGVDLLEAYTPLPVCDALKPFLQRLRPVAAAAAADLGAQPGAPA